jgi:tRNA (cmo5U34)-methyltransferase
VGQFHFTPDDYLELMHEDVPDYERLQDETARATADEPAATILELGTGTGETARRVLALHPGAAFVGLDESAEMLAAADLSGSNVRVADLRVARIEDPLPPGPFDLVVSCLAVHHLDAAGKQDLFRRVAEVTDRFVLADVVVPDDPADATTPLTPEFDLPDRLDDVRQWLEAAGFAVETTWSRRDLAVLRARKR